VPRRCALPSLSVPRSKLAPPGEQPVESQTEDAEDAEAVHTPLREKLSTEDLARLDELERQRLAYAAQAAAEHQVDDVEISRPELGERENGKPKDVVDAPRRRRKKEPAVA
jgi:hypothetical protein